MIETKLLQLVIAVLVLVALAVVFIANTSPLQGELTRIVGDPITIVYENIPCMINCLTKLQGDELAILSSTPFTKIDASDSMINWFPCNNEIMTIAYLIYEMARWDEDPSNPNNLIRNTGFSKDTMKQLLYDCLFNPSANPKCYNNKMSFLTFCEKDSYLRSYGFLPCASTNTLSDYISRSNMVYQTRSGEDITNRFICDYHIGSAYNPPYSLCSSQTEEKYDRQNCLPSWQILLDQRTDILGESGKAYARCEDYTLLFYSLFRAIDVPANEMSLSMNACELPCPCKALMLRQGEKVSKCDSAYYTQDYCYASSSLTVSGITNPMPGCTKDINPQVPDSELGRFTLIFTEGDDTYYFSVAQNFTSTGAPASKTLTLNSDYDDDTNRINIFGSPYVNTNILTDLQYNTATKHFSGIIQAGKKPDINVNAVFGFNIKINALTNCGESVQLFLGYINGNRETGYTLKEGDEASVMHNAIFTGDPYADFRNTNPSCSVSYTITPSTRGMIITDSCSAYYLLPSKTEQQLIDECAAFITQGNYFENTDADKQFPITLKEFFSQSKCV